MLVNPSSITGTVRNHRLILVYLTCVRVLKKTAFLVIFAQHRSRLASTISDQPRPALASKEQDTHGPAPGIKSLFDTKSGPIFSIIDNHNMILFHIQQDCPLRQYRGT